MAKTITLHNHTYTVINARTELAKKFYRGFLLSTDTCLREVYGTFSYAKARAYEYCRSREREFGTYDGVITGHNTCTFSYAFTGFCEGKKWLIYITKGHDYAIDYEALKK